MATRKRFAASARGDRSDPFSGRSLNDVFRFASGSTLRLIARESGTVEFKQNFQRGESLWRYAKTMAAFANAYGGYLVFGVKDKPREVVGMSNNRFEETDPAVITTLLNAKFAPEVHWQMHLHEVDDRRIGLIYVWPSADKPVIATSNAGDVIKDGDIYYRYRARSERIRFPELRRILEEGRDREQQLWLRHFKNIARVGVKNAAVFDPEEGSVKGRGGTFVIDRDLLSRLQFIREGEFREKKGAPALRLIGDAEILAAGEVVSGAGLPKAIRGPEIVDAFLKQEQVSAPLEYVKAACFESSAYQPIHYFARLAAIGAEKVAEVVERVQGGGAVCSRILDRLRAGDESLALAVPTSNSAAAKRKRELLTLIQDGDVIDPADERDARWMFAAVRMLPNDFDNWAHVVGLLARASESAWGTMGSNGRSEFRKAVAFADWRMCGRTA